MCCFLAPVLQGFSLYPGCFCSLFFNMSQKIKDEYWFLTEKLEEIDWALEGECNDIDCDKYMYKDLLKKRYKPVLEHNFSCMKGLKRDKDAILRILSQKRYERYRYIKCHVCRKILDKLNNNNRIASFHKKVEFKEREAYEYKGFWVHGKCREKVKTPIGWEKFW